MVREVAHSSQLFFYCCFTKFWYKNTPSPVLSFASPPSPPPYFFSTSLQVTSLPVQKLVPRWRRTIWSTLLGLPLKSTEPIRLVTYRFLAISLVSISLKSLSSTQKHLFTFSHIHPHSTGQWKPPIIIFCCMLAFVGYLHTISRHPEIPSFA